MTDMADDDDIALEALQAQVDLSLTFTQNLVSSWLKPSEDKLPSSKSGHNDEKELEEYMKLPPRLGVGASVSESTSLLSRDTARLKNKLGATSAKKRARKDDTVVPDAGMRSDDDAESRASVIKKKAKVDPFTPKQKTRKRASGTPKAFHEHPGFKLLKKTNEKTEDTAAPETPARGGQEAETPVTPLSGKKKQNKSRQSASLLIIERSESPAPVASQSGVAVASSSVIPDGPEGSPGIQPEATSSPSSATVPLSLPKHSSPHPPRTPPASCRASPVNSAQGPTLPLLNLHGPPPATEAASTSPSKKKRRRKKKKKKVHAQDEQAVVEEDVSDGSE